MRPLLPDLVIPGASGRSNSERKYPKLMSLNEIFTGIVQIQQIFIEGLLCVLTCAEHQAYKDVPLKPGHDQNPTFRHPSFWIKKGE